MKANLCQFEKYSYFGCCGDDYGTKEELKEGIEKNTIEFNKIKDKGKFAERNVFLRECGICRNLIFKDGKVLCPLHPELNAGKDHRDSLCDRGYLCATFKWFLKADEATQERFVEFIKKKDPNWYEYSIKMDNGSFLREFLGLKGGEDFIGLGCGALIVNDNSQVLLLRGPNSGEADQKGFWHQPGGTIGYGETAEWALKRELKEKLNIGVEFFGPRTFYNEIRDSKEERVHWVMCCYFARISSWEIKNMNPSGVEIGWFDLDKLPSPISEYTWDSIKNLKVYLKNKGLNESGRGE